MALNDTAKNLMLDALATAITHFSLHTEDAAAAANEIDGGSPAYARKSASWGSAASAEVETDSTFVFDVPAATSVKSVGFFGHESNATPFYGGANLTDEVFAGQGTYTLTSVTLTASDPA